MRSVFTFLAVAALATSTLAMAGCGKMTTSPQAGKQARATASAQMRNPAYDFVVGEPIMHGNLTIFPVASRTAKNDDRYITLDEGLKAGTVEVFETGHAPGAANNVSPGAANPPGEASIAVPDGGTVLLGGIRRLNERNLQGSEAQQAVNPPLENIIEPPAPETETATNEEATAQIEGNAPPVELAQVQQSLSNYSDPPTRGGNDVNRLMVLNKSDKPLYLMPGEIILGGDQDRTIGQELVLAPNPEPVPVDVFCVEHGRWGGRGAETAELITDSLANNQVRDSFAIAGAHGAVGADVDSLQGVIVDVAQEADRGKFIASVGQLSKSGRMAVQAAKDQGKVWEQVKLENAKAGVSNASNTFTANYTSEGAMQRLDPYIDALQQKVGEHTQVVGVIVAIDGKPASMDVFESTPLFRKLWPKLLKSYALDAANEAAPRIAADGKADVTSFTCPKATAESFLCEAMTHDKSETSVNRGLATTTRVSERMTSFTLDRARSLGNLSSGTTVQLPTVAPADADASESVHVSAFAH